MSEINSFREQLGRERKQALDKRADDREASLEERKRIESYRANKIQQETAEKVSKTALQPLIVKRVKQDVKDFAELMREGQALPTASLRTGVEPQRGRFFKARHYETLLYDISAWILPFTIEYSEESLTSARRRHGRGAGGVGLQEIFVTHKGMAIDVNGSLLNFKDNQHGIMTKPRPYGIRTGPGISKLDESKIEFRREELTIPLFLISEASEDDIAPIAKVTPFQEVIEEQPRVGQFRSFLTNLVREV